MSTAVIVIIALQFGFVVATWILVSLVLFKVQNIEQKLDALQQAVTVQEGES